jgi:hypothetical protein
VPALAPDIAILHAQYGDAHGNLRIEGPPVADLLFARASRKVVASVERIVSSDEMAALGGPNVPYFYVAAVAEVPFGAHPTACYPFYAYDRPHTALYHEAASAGADGSGGVTAPFVEPCDHADYLSGSAGRPRAAGGRGHGPRRGALRRGARVTHDHTGDHRLHARRGDGRRAGATIRDGTLVFHGFGSPLVQLAMHVAKRTHAPHMVLVAGATYAVDPRPPFLPPTSNDWVLDRGAEATLDIEELFDLAASGRMGRMFLSGVQIDRWGSTNVTRLGEGPAMKKLPGGGGGGNLSCDVEAITL